MMFALSSPHVASAVECMWATAQGARSALSITTTTDGQRCS
jgi:hypothetical protein